MESDEDKFLRDTARVSFIQYIKTVMPWFRLEEIHYACAAYFERVEQGQIDRLLLSMAPRGSKSTMSSIALPSYWMGKHPADKIMSVGYKVDLPRRFSRQVLGIMRSREYRDLFPNVKLAKDAHAVGYWNVEDINRAYEQIQRGEYQAAGVTSGIAGSGFNLGIVDDPLSEQDKDSKIAKDRVWGWWGPGFYTRRQPERSAIILIMTRWALDDLAGRLLEASRSGGDQWEVVNIPAILDGATAKTIHTMASDYPMPDARLLKEGDSFAPRRIPLKELMRSKANMTERDWQALYMGAPTEDEGQIIKRSYWRLWPKKELPECITVFSVYDTAFEAKESADYSAATDWGVFEYKDREDGGRSTFHMILLGRWKQRIESPDLAKVVTARCWGSKRIKGSNGGGHPHGVSDEDERQRINVLCGKNPDENVIGNEADRILIENKASGITLIKELRRQRDPRIPVQPWKKPRGTEGELGKYACAQLATLTFEQGSVWYMDRPWAEEVIDECAKCRFDGSDDTDDLPETVANAAIYVRQRFLVERESDIDEQEEAEAELAKKVTKHYYGAAQR